MFAGLGAWLASRRRWTLRVPDDAETADVAEPLSRILVRHCGVGFLTDDLVDGVQAAAGVVSYVETAPLRRDREPAYDPAAAAPGADGMEPI